jgi:hypothetical protein
VGRMPEFAATLRDGRLRRPPRDEGCAIFRRSKTNPPCAPRAVRSSSGTTRDGSGWHTTRILEWRSNLMKSIRIITTTAALVLALSGHVFAQGSLGDSGTSGAARGSAVQSAPSAVESSKGAVESSPSSGSGFGSTGSASSSLTTPNGSPARNSTTGGVKSTTENSGSGNSTTPNSR